MKTTLVSRLKHLFVKTPASLALLLALLPALAHADTSLQVGIAPPGSANESNSTAFLTWSAAAGGNYLVQSSTNISDPTAWTTEDAVSQSAVGPLKWMAPEALERQKYYRLILPHPVIFSVEPAIIAPGAPVNFYVLGQDLGTNVVLLINGVPQTNVVFQGSTAMEPPAFVPDVPGSYQVSLMVGGAVVSSFNVTCADVLANPELVLQGPPTMEPPASPGKKDFKGHVTLLKAFDDGDDAMGHTKTGHVTLLKAFDDDGDSFKTHTKTGHVTLLKAFDDGDDAMGHTKTGHVTLLKAFDDDGDSFKTHTKTGHVTLLKAFDDGDDAMGHTKTGHVTLLKAFDDDGDSFKTHTKTGHVTLLKAFDDGGDAMGHTKTGHVTLMKAFDDGDDSSARTSKTGHVTLMKAFDDGDDFATLLMPALMKAKEKANQCKFMSGSGPDGGTTPLPMPALMKAKEKANQTKCGSSYTRKNGAILSADFNYRSGASRGVAPFSGEVQECAVDMAIPGRDLDFIWARTYHSRIGRFGSATNGWTFSYDVRCAQNSSGGMDVYDGTGRKDTFALQATGVYTCPEMFREGTLNNNAFTLTFADTGRWVFNPFDGTAAAGKLIQIITRNGSIMTLGYDTGGRLVQVVDDLGRTNIMAYNTAGQLASVTDFTGRSVTYQYYSGGKSDNGSAGDLQSVTSPPVTGTPNGNDFPDGKTTTYTYSRSFPLDRENHLLLTVTDPKGQTAAAFSYEHAASATNNYLRCIAAQEGTNTPTVLNYQGLQIHQPQFSGTSECIANDPVGNVTEYFFDARNRCVSEDDYTGRATPGVPVSDTSNQPTGQVRSTDPAYYESTWSWNNDSLCTLEVCPGGQQMQYVYQSDFDPSTPARKRADCRVMRELAASAVDLDGDGVTDTTSRASYFSYDPRFGSDPGTLGTAQAVPDRKTMWEWVNGLAAPVGNSMAIKTKGTGANKNRTMSGQPKIIDNQKGLLVSFCVSATDPRGHVTKFSYDGSGNLRTYVPMPVITIDPPAAVDLAYNSYGQVTAITNLPDATGHRCVDTFTYYTSGSQCGYLQKQISDNVIGITTSYEYDARGNVTRVIDPRTNDWLFTYNALDECVQSQSAQLSGSGLTWRVTTQCAYDANDNVVQCATELRDASGTLQGTRADSFQYDGLDRLSQSALAVDAGHALTNRYAYDGNDECAQMLGGDAVSGADPHQAVAMQYDERGLLFRAITAPGSSFSGTNEFSYTADYNPATKKYVDSGDSLRVSSCTYDGFERLSGVTDPLGNQMACFYDANDNLTLIQARGAVNFVPEVRLAESHYEYDGLDRCVRAHDLFFDVNTQSPLGNGQAVTAFAYAPNGECVSVTDPRGHTTTYGYDTDCRPVSVTDALGNQVSVGYDVMDNPLYQSSSEIPAAGGNAQVFSITNIYDSLGRCVSTRDCAGNACSCSYDSLGRCVRTVDPRGTLAFYSYDLLDRCTAAIGDLDQDGQPDFSGDVTTTYTWSGSCDQLLAMTDSNTNTTSYAYDSLSRCTTVTHADGTQDRLIWSPHSNLLVEQDANGSAITNIYDLCDRIVHRDLAARNVLATTTYENFAYDGFSRLTGATNDAGGSTFAYDSLGDCVNETLNGSATTSTYDAMGDRLSLTYPGGRALSYTYDVLNRCASITDSGQQLAGYAYDGPDRVSTINYGNGTRMQIAYDGFATSPNAQGDYGFGQVRRIRHSVAGSGVVIDDRTFAYDPDQDKTARNLTSPFTIAGAAQAESFQYDSMCRLVNSLVTSNGAVARLTTYGFDRAGNRTNVTGEACSGAYTMSSAAPPADFQMNQYTTTACDSRAYDDDGNLVSVSSSASPLTYQYDCANRLVQVSSVDYGTGVPVVVPVASYAYDALGRRISKTVFGGGLPPVTTQFLYDGDSVIEERNGVSTTATYVCCDGVQDGRETDADCGGACFTMRRGGQDYYLHTDDQGNTLALTTTGGAVAERYDYDDYGAVSFFTGDGLPVGATMSTLGNPYCRGGLRLDSETGLHNDDGGDYFEPQTGRFIGTSHVPALPVYLSGGVENNPWSCPAAATSARKKDYVGHVTLMK